MANNTETIAVKTEFVNVVTEGELLLSPISATFSTIVTEASLIETPPIEGQLNKKSITTLYNKVFVNAIFCWAFTENKLRPWENTLEYKHFDTMYTNHWSLVNTIRKLHQQAQLLPEEAGILTRRDFILQQEIETHVSKITKAELHKRLCKPSHFHFKETPVPPPQPQASSSQTLSTRWHCICYMQSGEPMRCYKCNSLSHIKWNCQLYVCPLCGQRQPGHAQKNCPDWYHNDGLWGYSDIEGAKTGNYNRECWNSNNIYVFIPEPDGSIMKLLSFPLPYYSFQYDSCCFHSNIWIYFSYFHIGAGYSSHFWTILSTPHSN